MLDYIKKQIQARQPGVIQTSPEPEDVPNDVIVEYAQLFQELDDISVEGTDAGKERKLGIDIPLEDDVEVENIEFNLSDGRVTDVPGDATVTEAYQRMKTYDEFYTEAVEQVVRMPRETNASYDRRVSELAEKMYNEYCDYADGIGAFGFAKIELNEEKVPSKLNIDFGPMRASSDKSFMAKVKTFFATDDEHCITKKQLDSVRLVQNGAFAKIGEPLMAYMESHYDVPSGSSVWDVCTPKNLIVPKGNGDSFCVVLEYTNELTGDSEYFGWTRPVNNGSMENCERVNMESFVTETQYENKDQYIQEASTDEGSHSIKRRPLSRFYQEAIDFGGGEGDGGSDLPPAADDGGSNTTGNDTPPTPDGGDSTGGSDQNVDSGNASDAPEANGDSDNKETAAVNDVSSEIAEKVADDTQEDANASNEGDTEITFDDDTSTGTDTNSEIDNEPSVDEQLDDLDNTGSQPNKQPGEESMDDDTESDNGTMDDETDIDNMTIDELMEHGSEKLKSMPLNEIKKFLTSGTPEAVQEAFFITKRNVDKEIDINLRKCLGILNDKSIKIDKLLRNFKMAGHKLNRILTKATKLKGAYSSDEVQSIQKLNRALVELMTSLKKSNTASYVSSVKRNILAFTSESKTVAAFVEDRLKGNTTVQEGFVQEGLFLSPSNAKKRLGRRLSPVHSDLSSIVSASDNGIFTKGKLNKMYKPAKRTWGYSPGADGGITTSQERDVNTPQSENINDLQRILSKIIRKPKVQTAFSNDEIGMISDLNDLLDDFVDMIEAVIYDNNSADNKIILDKIIATSKKILAIIDNLDQACSVVNDSSETPTGKGKEETAMNDIDDSTSDTNTDDTADSVEDTTGEETPDEEDSAPDTEGDEE